MNERRIKEIEKLIEVYEELIEELEKKEEEKLLQEVKQKRNWLIIQLNQLAGPLIKEKEKLNCFFVKKNS